jgi:hypothetical protein
MSAFLIADETTLRKYGLGIIRPGRFGRRPFLRDGYLTRARSLREPAGQLGIDPGNLGNTVRRFNAFARTGIDGDFGRGTTDYQRITAGDINHKPNACLGRSKRHHFMRCDSIQATLVPRRDA